MNIVGDFRPNQGQQLGQKLASTPTQQLIHVEQRNNVLSSLKSGSKVC